MLSPTLRIDRVLTQFWHSNGRPLVRFKLGTVRLTEEVVKNQSAPFGVACTEMGGILPSLVATNSALKMQSSQDLFARPKQENGLHSLANITFDLTGNGAGPHDGMVRRGSLEVVESEEEAFHETTRGRY